MLDTQRHRTLTTRKVTVKKTLLRAAVATTIAMAAMGSSAPAFADAQWGVSTTSTTSDSANLAAGRWGGSVATSSSSSSSATVFGHVVHHYDSCYDHWIQLSWQDKDACDESFGG
jgi:hypothetical protein